MWEQLDVLATSELIELLYFIEDLSIDQESITPFYENLDPAVKAFFVDTDPEEEQMSKVILKFLNKSEENSIKLLYQLYEKAYTQLHESLSKIRFSRRYKKIEGEYFVAVKYTLPVAMKQLEIGDIDKISSVDIDELREQLEKIEVKAGQKGAIKASSDLKLKKPLKASERIYQNRVREFTDKVSTNIHSRLRTSIAEGIKAGERVPEISKRIREIYKKPIGVTVVPRLEEGKIIRAGYSYEIPNKRWADMVAHTESSWAANQGRLEAYKASGLVKNVRWITAASPCPDCVIMEDQILELFEAEAMVPYHVNCKCLTSPNTNIYTIDGYKPFYQIKNGDLVLTHKGRFRKVNKIIKSTSKNLYTYTIKAQYSGYKKTGSYSICVTAEHPFLTKRGWIEAKDLAKTDEILMLASVCKACNKIVPGTKHHFCSESCRSKYITKKQWANQTHREKMKISQSKAMKKRYKNNPNLRFELTRKAHLKIKELISEGSHPFQRPAVIKKAHTMCGKINYGQSRLERFTRAVLIEDLNINDFIQQYPVKRKIKTSHNYPKYYFPDFAFPKLKLIIECDGYYHQFRKKEDAERDKELHELGWDIFHLDSETILNREKNKTVLKNLLMNHNKEFNFEWCPISKIEKKFKKRQYRYNLSVEEDESFVAKDFVIHNCTWVVNEYKEPEEKLPELPTQFSDEIYSKPDGVGLTEIMKLSPGQTKMFDRALEIGNYKLAEKLLRNQHISSISIRESFKPGVAATRWDAATSPYPTINTGKIVMDSKFTVEESKFIEGIISTLPSKAQEASLLRGVVKGSQEHWDRIAPTMLKGRYGMSAQARNGTITIFADVTTHKSFIRENFIHEWAHLKNAERRYAGMPRYKKIISKEGWISEYSKSRTIPSEDFADSVMLYINSPSSFKTQFPGHYTYIDDMFKTMKHLMFLYLEKILHKLVEQKNYFDDKRNLVDKDKAELIEAVYYTEEKDYVKSIVGPVK